MRRVVLGFILFVLCLNVYAVDDGVKAGVLIHKFYYGEITAWPPTEIPRFVPSQARFIWVSSLGDSVCTAWLPFDSTFNYPVVWYFYSIDGGATWSDSVEILPPTPNGWRYSCLDVDNQGRPYISFTSMDSDMWGAYTSAGQFDGSDFATPVILTPDSSSKYVSALEVVGDGQNQCLMMYDGKVPSIIAGYSSDGGASWLPDPFATVLEVDSVDFFDVNPPAIAGRDDGYMCAVVCAAPDTTWLGMSPSFSPYATFPYFMESEDYGQTWSTPEPIFNDGAGNPVRPEGGTGGSWWNNAGTVGILSDGTPVFAVVMEATYDTAWNEANCSSVDTTITTVDSAGVIVSVDTTIDTNTYVGDYVFAGVRSADGTWSTEILNPMTFERVCDTTVDTTVNADGDTIITTEEDYYGLPCWGFAWYVSLGVDDAGHAVVYWIDSPPPDGWDGWYSLCRSYYEDGVWSSPEVTISGVVSSFSVAERIVGNVGYVAYVTNEFYVYFFADTLPYSGVNVGREVDGDNWFVLRCSPNPMMDNAVVSFTLPYACDVGLKVYDASGRCVRTLMKDSFSAGTHTVRWDARNNFGELMPSGVYFVRMSTHRGVWSRKVVLMR